MRLKLLNPFANKSCISLKSILTLFCFSLISLAVSAQTSGSLKGNIVDSETGEPLIGARVFIRELDKGAVADFDGNFHIKGLKPGTYNVNINYISYKPKEEKNVVIVEGKEAILNIKLESAELMLDEVVVVGRANRESEAVLMIEQRKAYVATQSVGARELSRLGASDVAAGVKKVVGVSGESSGASKQIYVRGMGDRYNNSSLNGLPIASPNPDSKLIPLDIFPSQIVQSIGVAKVFTADNYADFSGGVINIETKRFIPDSFFNISLSSSYNSTSTFQNQHVSQSSHGITNYLGYGNSQRSLPSEIASSKIYTPQGLKSDPFSPSFGFDNRTALPSLDFSLIGGKTYNINASRLGILCSVGFENNSNNKEGIYAMYNKQGGSPIRKLDTKDYVYETNLSGLLNISFSHGKNEINYNLLYINSSSDGVTENEGIDDNKGFVIRRRATYDNHRLINNQLNGVHPLSRKVELDWRTSYAKAQSDEPNRANIVFSKRNEESVNISSEQNGVERYFHKLDENEYAGATSVKYKFNNNDNFIQAGVQTKYKDRNFNARIFNYFGMRGIQYDVYNADTKYFTADNFTNNDATMRETPKSTNSYKASRMVNAGFVNLVYNINSKFLLNLGIRFENSQQSVDYKLEEHILTDPFLNKTITNNEFFPSLFPSLNLKYAVDDKQNFRLGMSRTVTHPEFKEMSPFPYIDLNNDETRGNENIQSAYNYNIDLKYEVYPNPAEMIALTLFGKYLDKPIESYIKGSSTTVYSYTNTKAAYIAGAELEIKQNFKSILSESNPLSKLYIGFNAAYIFSRIELGDDAVANTNTNKIRPLQGASPFLINADINYPIKLSSENELLFTSVYNVYGKRISSIGTDGRSDIYETPKNSLDFIISYKLGKKLSAKLSAKNVLNAPFRLTQNTDAGVKTVREYTLGSDIGVGITYNF